MAEHYAAIIGKLDKKPVVIRHSSGGLLTQIVTGHGLAAASVAIDSAPSAGCCRHPFRHCGPQVRS